MSLVPKPDRSLDDGRQIRQQRSMRMLIPNRTGPYNQPPNKYEMTIVPVCLLFMFLAVVLGLVTLSRKSLFFTLV
jgi:hypothetical protein